MIPTVHQRLQADDPMATYDVCRVCSKRLNARTRDWARRSLTQQMCSTECRRIDTRKRFGCCDKAKPLHCVCAYAFRCQVHGDRHIGTHD